MQKILRIGLIAVLLAPLIFGTSLLYPFVVYRTYFFYFLIDALFVVALWQGAIEFRDLKKSRLAIALSLLFFAISATDLAAAHPLAGLWGNYERMMGLVTIAHLALFILLAVSVFRERRAYEILFKAFVAVATAVSLYGILQHANVAFRIAQIDERLFSTIGNPAFLAGCLLLSVFFSFFLLQDEKRSRWRTVWMSAIAVQLIAIYESGTRGAILGLIVGVIFIFFSKKSRFARYALLAIFLSVIAFFALRSSPFVNAHPTLRRIASISFADVSVRERLLLWKSVVPEIRTHWLIGVGDQNIRAALDRAFNPLFAESWYDSTHNIVLDLLLAHGIIGLFAAFFVVVSLFAALYRLRKQDNRAAVILAGAFVAYAMQGLFIFDTLVVLLPLALLFGYAMVAEMEKTPPPPQHSILRPFHTIVACSATLVALCFFVFGYERGIHALSLVTKGYRQIIGYRAHISDTVADIEEGEAVAYFGYGSLASVVRDAEDQALRAHEYSSQDAFILLHAVDDAYANAREYEGETSQMFSDPAKVFLDVPNPENPFLRKGLSYLDSAIAISPRRIDTYFAKAQTLYAMGETSAAEEWLQKTEPLFPNNRGDISYRIGLLKETHAGAADVLSAWALAQANGVHIEEGTFDTLARHYVEKRAWADAVVVFQTMIDRDPKNVRALSNLAQAYKQLGDKKRAKETALRLIILDPRLSAEVRLFIDSL